MDKNSEAGNAVNLGPGLYQLANRDINLILRSLAGFPIRKGDPSENMTHQELVSHVPGDQLLVVSILDQSRLQDRD